MMQVRPLVWDGEPLFIISHFNISERKLAEDNIRHVSNIDSLTGLFNRRRFDSFLDEQWRRARRNRQPVSLILIDIDFFKSINDRHGHIAGDGYLKNVAAILQKFGRRPDDLVARYGGEEFGVILGNTTLEAAKNACRTNARSHFWP